MNSMIFLKAIFKPKTNMIQFQLSKYTFELTINDVKSVAIL